MRAAVLAACLAVCVLSACATFRTTPAIPAAPRAGVLVSAPADRTFDAAVQSVTALGLTIATVDRAAGVIVTHPIRLSAEQARAWVDCGRSGDTAILADHGTLTVIVRGTPASSDVRATGAFGISPLRNPNPPRCESTGALETQLEADITRRAQSR